jgi:hypothetical protein
VTGEDNNENNIDMNKQDLYGRKMDTSSSIEYQSNLLITT